MRRLRSDRQLACALRNGSTTRSSARRAFSTPQRLLLSLLLSLFAASSALAEESSLSSNELEQVYDVLQRRCHQCHSHAAGKMRGGLTLDSAAGWLAGGDSGPAVVPASQDESMLVHAIRYEDEALQMPPAEKLPAEEIALLVRWIERGAVNPRPDLDLPQAPAETAQWWSLKALERPRVPQSDTNHPIDAFLQAELAKHQLSAAPAADRRALIRRVYYDLIGLVPSFEQVESFVNDPDPAAYEKLVDELLNSPRYGEHWARHWLDVVHYADTHGNDHDYARPNAWPYRDYVIQSFNSDKPYAQFIQEQIAADALFPENRELIPALGFLAAGPWDHTVLVVVREDTLDHANARNLDRDNMVSTVMSTFQGLTVHCARCHNHKFDQISQEEYYGLQAVFAGVDRADRPYRVDESIEARKGELLARKAEFSTLDSQRLQQLAITEYQARLQQLQQRLTQDGEGWVPLTVLEIHSETDPGTLFEKQGDASWLVSGNPPAQDTFVVTAQSDLKDIAAIRLEAIADSRLPGQGPGRYSPSGNFHLTDFTVSATPLDGSVPAVDLKFSRALSDHDEPGSNVANAIDGKPQTLWGVHPQYGQNHEAVFELATPVTYSSGAKLVIRLQHHGAPAHQLGRFRLSVCTAELAADRRSPVPSAVASLLTDTAAQDRVTQAALHWLAQELTTEIDQQIAQLPPSTQYVYAATRDFTPDRSFKPSPQPRPIHLLLRGNIEKPAELIGPAALSCMDGLQGQLSIPSPENEAERRAALARWLTEPNNVLTWRTIVNRVWHYHFGRGICDTPNDLGRMGGTPSHPELLDWLALWFRDDASGSLKSLHRLIVTSEAYRQTSNVDPTGPVVDADNRLLWRMNRARLTAEQFRDTLLQLSDSLDLTMGGPSVVQFNHKNEATFAPADGSPPYLDYENFDPDNPANRRRAIYRFLFRTVPDPLMDALDAPDGGAMTPVRSTSSTAPQALALLNNPFVIRQCEHIADAIRKHAAATNMQVQAAFQRILLRNPTPAELQAFAEYYERHGLANVCQMLLNSNEFMYVD